MSDLKSFLLTQGYNFFKLKKTASAHFTLKAKINNIKGIFIIDTGASNSCVGLNEIDLFNLTLKNSNKKAAGAGSTNIETKLSHQNHLKVKSFKIESLTLIIIDLSHINTALVEHNSAPINGIIGADILKKYNAVVDYKYKALYLKV